MAKAKNFGVALHLRRNIAVLWSGRGRWRLFLGTSFVIGVFFRLGGRIVFFGGLKGNFLLGLIWSFGQLAEPELLTGKVDRNKKAREKDRKSTRLNSSHMSISYAVFCLKKK